MTALRPSVSYDEGIRYLQSALPGEFGTIVEEACRRNLRLHQRYLRSSLPWASPHAYGPDFTVIRRGRFARAVFQVMLADGACSAPTLSRLPIYTGKIEILAPLEDKVVKLVDDARSTIYNVTLPEHIFFPGIVKLVVHETGEETGVAVSGQGRGNWALPNERLAPTLFRTIFERYLIPRASGSNRWP